MKLIALTGGIAAGKSTIARRLAELGAVHIDADQLARMAVLPGTPGLAQIVDHFGSGVLNEHGELDRQVLASRAFGDPEQLAALNDIVHPQVQELARRHFAAAEELDPDAVVVYDVPLLVEAGLVQPWDLVVVAEAPSALREERLVALRGMTREDARRRIANQAGDAERRAIADEIIDTGGTEAETLAQVDALWERLKN